MTIADAKIGGTLHEQGGVYPLPPYPRCQERRTTFRHRFNCLLSNGSHLPSHSEFPAALRWGPRWTDTSRLCAILPSRSTETVRREVLCPITRGGFPPLGGPACLLPRRRTMERKITDRHAKATTTTTPAIVFPPRHTDPPDRCRRHFLSALLFGREIADPRSRPARCSYSR